MRKILMLMAFSSLLMVAGSAKAQETLGAINGTVSDAKGAVMQDAKVVVVGEQTGLTRTVKSTQTGHYEVLNLPIGTYEVTVTHDGFETSDFPGVPVQEAKTTTVNAAMKIGQMSQSVTVTANTMLNATDTNNGYTLDKEQIQAIPLATGSFTQMATLAPGVSAELLSGTGTNAGYGNQPIWANGQRDTSNSFQVNGVDVTNLFNGKSSSETTSQRLNFNIGEYTGPGGSSQSDTSVYGSNGQGLASPPPEFIQELRVNTSMYDAQQGQTSGAHVDVNTSGGGNKIHGQVWGMRGTNWLNADPFFYNQEVGIGELPASLANPELHKYTVGGTVGGPIIKNKLFYFLGYERQLTDDQYPYSQIQVPFGLSNDRPAALASYYTASNKSQSAFPATPNPVAIALLQYQFPNGQYLIPSAGPNAQALLANGFGDAILTGTSTFKSDQANAALDYDLTSSDHMAARYYYQHGPTSSPFGLSNTPGFVQTEDTGAQVGALSNSITLGTKVNWEQRIGFSRQKTYSDYNPGITPGQVGMTIPAPYANVLPGIRMSELGATTAGSVYVGPYSNFVNAGYFENRLAPSTNAFFSFGAHTISVGGNFAYNQLNIENHREGHAELRTTNLPNLLNGKVSTSGSTQSTILLGASNRYYRSNDAGAYIQDKYQATPHLSITAGVRYDYDGPFSEKYGNLFNFDPTMYSATTTSVINSGFIVAGNNPNYATPGVSNSTLKGRQWGIAPRVGFAYSVGDSGKLVVRGGFGLNYDRGEYFQYLSPPAGQGISGPFGVTEEAPLATYQLGSGNLSAPFGTTPFGNGASNPSALAALLPTVAQIQSQCTAQNVYSSSTFACKAVPQVIGDYNVNNKLPYAENWLLDVQWQVRPTLAITLGYIGNGGRHEIIPVPFNQPKIATPASPYTTHAGNTEMYSYGYQIFASTPTGSCTPSSSVLCPLSTEPYDTYSGGNVDLRVPYVGYDPNSTSFEAVGVSAYDALQAHIEKRMSHGIQVGASYTYSHTLDEQSDLGLFFTGDDPSNLASSYATSDFDRTHILSFNYLFTLPDFDHKHDLLDYFTSGWSLLGVTVAQSGEPYSIYDYSGSVGSQQFGNNIQLSNPALPLAAGVTPKQAKTGHVGAFLGGSASATIPALNPSAFQIPLVTPGTNGAPPCDSNGGPGGGTLCDVFETTFVPGQRNLFRQAFQKRADVTLQKSTRIGDNYNLIYRFEVYNVTNTPSFDIPTNEITLNPDFGELGLNESGTQVQPTASSSVTTPTGTASCSGSSQNCAYELYTTPGAKANNLGVVKNTIGGPRAIQMSLHFLF
jgi:hypothetical protein